ncbi:MAG: rhodanese-like domain-containing protein [Ignavibacteriae bacterium]|nr:rhodanese-like domain-containing protein [Ignavibacteriota bacterium]NOG96414.1 rhodanese-like domain-containing protein [Ignavibacteriota bacterium]
MKKNIKIISVIILLHFFSLSCLEDSVQPELNIELENGAELLRLIESRGDYLNSDESPALITASELFNNLNNYLIIDVRDSTNYLTGFIEGSVNLNPKDILSYFDSINTNAFEKIILVSSTGEAAAYCNACLRYAGFNNTFTLRFGMASWNQNFSNIWKNSLGSINTNWEFTRRNYEKSEFSSLPILEFQQSDLPITDKLRERVQALLNNGFQERQVNGGILLPKSFNSGLSSEYDPTITMKDLYSNFNKIDSTFGEYFIICFGREQVYYPAVGSNIESPSHPPNSVWYRFPIIPETRTISMLQTIPNDKTIAIYSAAGYNSASLTALLRILGYNAKSILFGAHNFHYYFISTGEDFGMVYFRDQYIEDYPYVLGGD